MSEQLFNFGALCVMASSSGNLGSGKCKAGARPGLKRKNAARPGSLDWEEINEGLPSGPKTVEDLYNWPARALDVLSAKRPECVQQLVENLLSGVSLVTHYSGKGTAESALLDVADITRERENMWIPSPRCASACDISSKCRDLLLRHDERCKPKHVFGDMLDRIPMQSPPLSGLSAPEVQQHLLKHASQLYNTSSKSFCYQHYQPCCLWDGLESPGNPRERTGLLLSAAGFTCTDWSPRRTGKRPGLLGSSAPVYYHWVTENRQLQPDLLLWENSSQFDPAVLQDHLGDEYVHIVAKVCPTMIGWPQTRERYFGVAVLRQSCCFLGSAEEFLAWFQCRVELDGDALLQAGDAEVLTMMRERAAKRGHHLPPGQMPSLTMAVSPSGMVALAQYTKMRDAKAARTGAFLCDLDRNEGFASCGSFLHSTPTHSSVYSFVKERLCTGKEMLSAMGAFALNT